MLSVVAQRDVVGGTAIVGNEGATILAEGEIL